MLKKLFTLCIVAITINANAQVIKTGKPKNTEPSTEDTYYSPYNRGQRPSEEKPFEFKKRSMIQINIFEFVFTNVAVSYEIFSKDGRHGFKIPFTFGIGGQPDTNAYTTNNTGRFLASKNRIFETGLHYNYYILGQKRVSPFMGIGVNAGAFNYWEYAYTYVNNYYGGGYYQQVGKGDKKIGSNISGALFFGILFNPSETVTFGFKTGLGFRRYGTDFNEYTYPYGLLEINLGFKF
jgi:hypothetical protein